MGNLVALPKTHAAIGSRPGFPSTSCRFHQRRNSWKPQQATTACQCSRQYCRLYSTTSLNKSHFKLAHSGPPTSLQRGAAQRLPGKMAAAQPRTVLVLYGSETGNAQELAEELGRSCQRLHFQSTVEEMNAVTLVRPSATLPQTTFMSDARIASTVAK